MKSPFLKVSVLSAVAVAFAALPLHAVPRTIGPGGGKTSYQTGNKAIINERDAQLDKDRVNLKDKIEGTIEAIYNRINWLKMSRDSSRSSKFASTEEELKSMTLSIKADIDKAKEDINNAMNNGEIFLSERDTFIQKIDRYKQMLKDLRVVDPADLDKN